MEAAAPFCNFYFAGLLRRNPIYHDSDYVPYQRRRLSIKHQIASSRHIQSPCSRLLHDRTIWNDATSRYDTFVSLGSSNENQFSRLIQRSGHNDSRNTFKFTTIPEQSDAFDSGGTHSRASSPISIISLSQSLFQDSFEYREEFGRSFSTRSDTYMFPADNTEMKRFGTLHFPTLFAHLAKTYFQLARLHARLFAHSTWPQLHWTCM